MKFYLQSFLIYFLINKSLQDAYRFRISYFPGAPDGVYKNILGVNGKFPGPVIEKSSGDKLTVIVVNEIVDRHENKTTMHWHGILHHHHTIFQDGPSQVTQCPLNPGRTQIYSFPLISPSSGTYWYHGHVKSQYTEGLWGPLIIRGTPQLHDYFDELVFSLNDWYHPSGYENEEWYLSKASGGTPPYPDSILINGRGRYPCDIARRKGFRCDESEQLRPVYDVQPGRKYRIRVINASAWLTFYFSIDRHKLSAIEVDGTRLNKSPEVDWVTVGPAQRFSFLITTDQLQKRFLVRSWNAEDLIFVNGINEGRNINKYPQAVFNEVTAVIRYNDEAHKRMGNMNAKSSQPELEQFDWKQIIPPPRTRPRGDTLLDDFILEPNVHERAPESSKVDKRFVLTLNFTEVGGIRRGSFNGTPVSRPPYGEKPLLLRYILGEPLPLGAFALDVKMNDVVEIKVINGGEGSHPIHLHGHHYWVIGTGPLDERFGGERWSLDGAKRDTVLVHGGSFLTIRFLANNPGTWTFHCHIDWHLLSGMAATLVTHSEEARNALLNSVPKEYRKVCADNGILF